MKNKPYRYLLYLGLRWIQTAVLLLPRKVAIQIAGGLARIGFYLLGRERGRTLEHLSLAYGAEKSVEEICELGRRVFIHFAEVAVDVLRFPRLTRGELDRLVEPGGGFFLFDRLLAEGRGVILLSAHLGNWELMGALFRLYGYPGALIGRRIYYEKFNDAIIRLREKVTLRTIYQDAPAKEYLKVLRQNEILAILGDQDLDRFEGIFVPFFGRPAYTVTTPVRLALATGAPVVPTFLIREGDRYRLVVEEPIRVEMKGTREEAIYEYTARWSRVIEEKIRAYPEQWAWMHRRWRSAPPAPFEETPVPAASQRQPTWWRGDD